MRPDPQKGSRWFIAAAALAGAVLTGLLAVTSLLSALAALILVFLPVYLITWPLLRPQLGSAGAFTVAGGLSIGMVAIGGLVLNLLPWGLQAATWVAYVVVLLLIALALGRRPRALHPTLGVVSHEVVLLGIGGAMMLTALLFARMYVAYPAESFTQLWITPSADARASSVEVSIRSEEQAATRYLLEVRLNGKLVQSWSDVRLATGETWSRTVAVGSGRIEAQLLRINDLGTVYRHVILHLGATSPAVQGPGA